MFLATLKKLVISNISNDFLTGLLYDGGVGGVSPKPKVFNIDIPLL